MTSAVAEKAPHHFVPLKSRDRATGRDVEVPGAMMIVGVPGGPPNEEGIILVRPVLGSPEGVPYTDTISGQEYMKQFRTELHFVKSPRFPEGLRIGVIENLTDMGMGQPFVESSSLQVGLDTYERLRAYAYGEPYLSMPERRAHAKATEQYLSEHSVGINREDTTTPREALAAVADDRLDDRIAKAVAEALAAERAKK